MDRDPKSGEIVVTFPKPENAEGFIAGKELLEKRKVGVGRVKNFVPGYGGDVWFIEHPDKTVAPYTIREFDEPQTELKFPE